MSGPRIGGIILAGGKSRRMGRDKAFLELGGRPLIEIVLDRVQDVAAQPIIVTNTPERYCHLGARVVADILPGVGTLGGIHAGLTASRYHQALVVACDMPWLNPPLLRYMASLSPSYEAVVPLVCGYYEPLHAVYSRDCLQHIEAELATGRREAFSFYPRANVRYVLSEEMVRFDPELRCLKNANTPAEWREVEAEFAAGCAL